MKIVGNNPGLREKPLRAMLEGLEEDIEDETGVTRLAAIRAICKTRFARIMANFGYDMDSILSVRQLVSNAIILDGQETDDDEIGAAAPAAEANP